MVPNVYNQLISELRKDSPISSWLPSFIRKDTILLLSFLEEENDIFSSYEKTLQVTEAFPYLTKVLSEILKYHSCTFLPKNISKLVINMIELREDFNRLAEERAVKRTKPKKNYESSKVEIYPNNPEHTMENVYKADTITQLQLQLQLQEELHIYHVIMEL